MSENYQVFARKYRPGKFADLLGQDALVKTVQNSIKLGRMAHAFILTGVRGVGKTTTARIIAKAVNCEKITDGAIEEPCNECESCIAINEDRHLDVMELDAASHTGIDDMRDIAEKAGYKPAMGHSRVYILDEVHMLSKNAFAGLLKTLEEPPPQVIFILATTDIEQVPVTILSRCQRFDLSRVSMETLQSHYKKICDAESLQIDDDALKLLAMNAEGSVRDGLSLLEQAAAISGGDIKADIVREMLGLADRETLLDLFDSVLRGDAEAMFSKVAELDSLGVDSLQIIKDLLDLDYNLTRMKLLKGELVGESLSELESTRGKEMIDKLTVASLSRIWQVLFKGFTEVKGADNRRQALEMVLVRLLYLSSTPTTEELMSMIEGGGGASTPPTTPPPTSTPTPTPTPTETQSATPPWQEESKPPEPAPAPESSTDLTAYDSLAKIEKLVRDSGDIQLAAFVQTSLHLVLLEPPVLQVRLVEGASNEPLLPLRKFLQSQTGESWQVAESPEKGEPTLKEQKDLAMKNDEMVLQVKEYFPDAVIKTTNVSGEV